LSDLTIQTWPAAVISRFRLTRFLRIPGSPMLRVRWIATSIPACLIALGCGSGTSHGSADGGTADGGTDGTVPCADPPDSSPMCDAEIIGSNYVATCETSGDCVLVGVGDFCTACGSVCTQTAISRTSLPQYSSDVAKTPSAATIESCVPCCGPTLVACCQGGFCVASQHCQDEN
jgi:hypothetical protein